MQIQGRTVVITGGGRGIGREMARSFAARGANLALWDLNQADLDESVRQCAELGVTARGYIANVTQEDAVAAAMDAVVADFGGIDVLVNNASGFGMGDDEAGWAAGLSVDVMAMVRASHAAVPALLASPGSSIVHISSISGFSPSTRAPAYAAVKAAMMSYTRSQAAMLARQGVRVNCIAPGSIEFPGGVWDLRKQAGEALYDRTLGSIPFGRMGTPEEIAEVALFLASSNARWVTGQVIAVDGGQMLGA